MKNIHPGALYRCPITAEEYDCERVDIDGEGKAIRHFVAKGSRVEPQTFWVTKLGL